MNQNGSKEIAFYTHAILVRVNSNETLVPFDRGAL